MYRIMNKTMNLFVLKFWDFIFLFTHLLQKKNKIIVFWKKKKVLKAFDLKTKSQSWM